MLTAALALGLAGCGESGTPSSSTEPAHQAQELQPAVPASPTGSAVAPPPVPRAPEAPASACRVSPLATLARTTRASRLTFLPSPLAGAAPLSGPALIVEGDTTELLRLSQSFTVMSSRTLTARFETAVRTGDDIVALATAPADPSGVTHYRAFWLATSASRDMEMQLPVPVQNGGAWRRNAAGDQVVFTWTDGRKPPLLLRFVRSDATPLRFDALYPLIPDIDLDEGRSVQLLRVALDDDSFAAVIRVGSAEGIGTEVVLARPSGSMAVHALEDIADVEAMAIVGDEVWVIATYEFSRPLLLRVAANGELATAPVELARDATLPPELAGGDPARLMVDGERLLLRRRNPMGDPLLPDALVASRPHAGLPADVLRVADTPRDAQRYVVVYQDRDEVSDSWPIHFASLDCAPR